MKYLRISPTGLNADQSRAAFRFLTLLLVADLVFVFLYALYGFKFITDPRFGIIEDRSYGEVFQYIKEIWIIVLMSMVAVERRMWRYVLWAGIFAYLLLDDSCQFHEIAGAWLVEQLALPSIGSLRGQDLGELLYSGTVGGGLIGCVLLSFRRAPADYRHNASRLLALLLALGFFGVVVDSIHVNGLWLAEKAIGAIEDGGEQVVMSLIAWFAYGMSLDRGADSGSQ